MEEKTYFSTSLKRPADQEKTEKGKLIVYVVCFITQTVYNVFINLHSYIIVLSSGKFGSWNFIMNIMCCFSKSWEQLLNILQGVVSHQVAYISLHPLRLCKHIDQTQGPMSYSLLLTGKVQSLFSLSPLPMFKLFLLKEKF